MVKVKFAGLEVDDKITVRELKRMVEINQSSAKRNIKKTEEAAEESLQSMIEKA